MWKPVTVGMAVLTIASVSLVYAQQPGSRQGGQRWQPSAEDLQAFGEARLAALKAGLMLTPDQARNWPAFEQAARDFAKQRIAHRMTMRSTPRSDDPVDRLRRRATTMSDIGAGLKKLADGAEPLYKSLDENQKRRFATLNRLTRSGQFRTRENDGSLGWGSRREGRPERFGEERQ
jgi:zinc resistance-associated protein